MSTSTQQAESSLSTSSLFENYRKSPVAYDEIVAADGSIRPHWQKFATALDQLGAAELGRRWEQGRRLIHENGVTYNVHGDPQGMDRPWELDAMPLLIAADEWRHIASSLVQRARLLNQILGDLYGPQRSLTQGNLPPELVFGHPGFLRPCHGHRVPHDCHLQIYAADLARSPDGSWWVLADRTQAPLGVGYALENRVVISRMFPNIFHDCQVHRLAVFFRTLRDTLRSLAPRNRDNPRIVLLTPGPKRETYFEDAYLARYLGYTLVEGGDLAVRDDRVFLKTLGGLLPVDVILRRVNDEFCDPLELRGDSPFGVPGLVQAARKGNVAIANSLGSGLLETPAIMAFLPALCEKLLGEKLKMPSVATWWCGHPEALKYVIEHLDRLVIKPAFPRRGVQPVFGEQLSTRERAHLAARLKARPRDFIGQEQVIRSTTPVWSNGRLQPWHVALRAYVVSAGNSYVVMHGALTRTSASLDPLDVSLAAGEGSKDAWVLSDGPVSLVSLLNPAGQPMELRRSGNELPSRVADNLYWLGRHVERTEGSVRLLRTLLSRLTSESEPGALSELPVLLQTMVDHGPFTPELTSGTIEECVHRFVDELQGFLYNREQPGSLRSQLSSIHHLASMVRDRISIDSWRILNRLDQEFSVPSRRHNVQLSDVLEILNHMVINLAAFSGLGTESMTRGPGWRFLDMGRRLERGLYMLRLLRSTLVNTTVQEVPLLEALLEVADSSITYRSRYMATLQLAPVIDLLLTDESNLVRSPFNWPHWPITWNACPATIPSRCVCASSGS